MTAQLTLDGSGPAPSAEAPADSIRDRERERRILTEAASGYVAHAGARLEAGQPIYGDSWAWIGTRRHLLDLLELAADLGARAALAEQALDLEHTVSDETQQAIRASLRRVATVGAEAHATLRQTLDQSLSVAPGGRS